MNRMLDIEPSQEALVRSLGRIARCPRLTEHLHRVLGSFCHESRNVLNSLKMSFYLMRRVEAPGRRDDWCVQEQRYETLERFIDRLHQLCRPLPFMPLRLPLHLLFDERRENWTRLLAASGKRLLFEPREAPVVGAFDPGRLGPALDDLVEWRSRSGPPDHDLVVSWSTEADQFVVEWSEVRGRRSTVGLSSASNRSSDEPESLRDESLDVPGLLALPLLTRVVALHGGHVEVGDGEPWSIRLLWPMVAGVTLRQTTR